MREPGEPMEFGIFDFYKVLLRAFGEEEDGAGGSSNGRWGMSSHASDFDSLHLGQQGVCM